MWYRFSKKIIKAEDEQDPLGISDIKPTELSDDPYVKKLNALIKSGLMTESEFFDEMTENKRKVTPISDLGEFGLIERLTNKINLSINALLFMSFSLTNDSLNNVLIKLFIIQIYQLNS